MLEEVVGAMLTARAGLHSEFMRLHRKMLAIARTDDACRPVDDGSWGGRWWR